MQQMLVYCPKPEKRKPGFKKSMQEIEFAQFVKNERELNEALKGRLSACMVPVDLSNPLALASLIHNGPLWR